MATPLTAPAPEAAPAPGTAPPSGTAAAPPGQRGVLTISRGAAEHVVEGVIRGGAPHVRRSQVSVGALDEAGVEVAVEVELEYPTDPLRTVLHDLRLLVAHEAGRQLGRPVRRVDLRVGELVVDPPRPRRRVE